jgi:hypothetical protein
LWDKLFFCFPSSEMCWRCFNRQQTYVQSISDRKLFGTSQSEELVLKLHLFT